MISDSAQDLLTKHSFFSQLEQATRIYLNGGDSKDANGNAVSVSQLPPVLDKASQSICSY